MGTFESVNGVAGILVKVGLGQPINRAFVAGTTAAGLAFLATFPKESFRSDGSLKPFKGLSAEVDSTYTHFLLVPVVAATAVYLFT